MSAFLCKKLVFFCKYNTFTQSNSIKALLEVFKFCFQVMQDKRLLLNENVNFIDHPSETRLPDGCKLSINWKKDSDVTNR